MLSDKFSHVEGRTLVSSNLIFFRSDNKYLSQRFLKIASPKFPINLALIGS